MTDLAAELAWLDGHLNHESSSVGVAAGQVEGLDLAPMRELVGLLGDPQADVPVIHVTGTNGKGSTAAMLTALLRAHGLSVGTYTSPHLERVNERIRRDGEPIGDHDLAEVLAGVRAVEPLLGHRPTWFELVTAAALRWFAEAPVDVAVVEVGLLGRYDATNVVDGRVAVITSIGGDHTDFAPGWEATVCSEKAGIVRPDATAVLGAMSPELRAVVAAEGPARLWAEGVDFEVLDGRVAIGGRMLEIQGALGRYDEVFLPLHGSHQAANAAVAVAAVEAFFDRALDVDVVREGLAAVELEGRVEVVRHQPLVVLDGAHNPDALRALAATVDEEFTAVGARLVVVGQLAGRDPVATADALRALRPDLVVCTTAAEGDRGLPADRLAAACEAAGLPTEVAADPARAVALALGRAQEEDLVVVTGSFRLLGPARRALT
ncbi:MAG: bifunctional folylpolyglutamate synthase/dihydrofolate synthase [Microthrixaceae bacterium]